MARLGVRLGLGQHGEAGALDAVGDPGLRPIQDVDGALPPGARADCLEVCSCVGLGEREPAAQLSACELRQVLRLQAFGAVFLDEQRHHEVRVEDAGERHPYLGDPADDARVELCRQAEAAVLRADGGAEKAERLHLLDHFRRPGIVVLELHDLRGNVARQPAVDGVHDLARLVGIRADMESGWR